VSGAQERPCVVHLVRAANGLDTFSGFLDAIAAHPPGADHDLVLAMKGFSGPRAAEPYLELASGLAPEALFFSDEGFDLGVYIAVAARLERQRYCFTNSFSRPLAAGWLAMLDSALAEPATGLVGATGSWASTRSWMAHVLRLPNAYRGVLPAPEKAIEHFMAIEASRSDALPAPSDTRSATATLLARLRTVGEIPGQTLPYERFPAYHVRTNAFMINGATLSGLDLPSVGTKRDVYLIESGRRSITRQVQRAGLRTLVVDRLGETYEHQRWHLSDTFWQGSQQGLLVADNQTRCYEEGDFERRSVLSQFAWGKEAKPARP
jgi:hypothetical protein